jgi:signal transduction histidine kinase
VDSLAEDAVTDRSRLNSAALHSITILTTPEAATSELWISITNSGVEISPEACRGIFDQFYRISNSAMAGGNGLGLTIVKKRIEKLRGSISVISQNQQTTFTIKLPL